MHFSPPSPLVPLAAHGPRILNSQGRRVRLRGVNRSGMEYSVSDEGFAAAAGITENHIAQLVRDWRANVIRLPFNQDWALRGHGPFSAEDYLTDLDRVIGWAAQSGAYTLLDLQWLDAEREFGADRQFVAPLPNPETPGLWSMLASRYRDQPAVLFDIFNEPHDRLQDDPYPLFRPDGSLYPPAHRRVSMTEWQPWAELLIDTIRAEAPEALIFVSGVNWGYALRGFPLDRPNLVYSTHVYPGKGARWFEAFGHLANVVPVFAGEFGGRDADLEWGARLLDYFDELDIGWAAWSISDEPRLMADTGGPTPFGELVRDRLWVS
ncbi:MAG: glycoside hydrolase family 5 protein [Acidobacteriota bacterium]